MGSDLNITKELQEYILSHGFNLHPVQKEIINYNNKLGYLKKMQISVTQGYFFQFLIQSFAIKKILEIGTFTGYSSLTMGLALPKNGKLICLDTNKITSNIAKKFFKKAHLGKKTNILIGPALDSLKDLINNKSKFDLVFIDADKENYKKYYELSFNLLKKDGFIIIDNVLWHGEVVDKNNKERLTKIIRDFNKYVNNDVRVENMIIPIGDGFSICRKL